MMMIIKRVNKERESKVCVQREKMLFFWIKKKKKKNSQDERLATHTKEAADKQLKFKKTGKKIKWRKGIMKVCNWKKDMVKE